jgi:hypothetical protein
MKSQEQVAKRAFIGTKTEIANSAGHINSLNL